MSTVAFVLADDLTGANATGALLRESGFRAWVLPHPRPDDLQGIVHRLGRQPSMPCAILLNTGTRTATAREAAGRVERALRLGWSAFGRLPAVAKRVDSTLRGNVGAELETVLRLLGSRAFAVVAPAYPACNRVVLWGELRVGGVPVHSTYAGGDPLSPVSQSQIPTLLRQQSALPVAHVTIAQLERARPMPGELAAWAARLLADGQKVLVMDGTHPEHLELGAGVAVALLEQGWGPAVCVDPGPFTAAVFRRLAGRGCEGSGRPTAAPPPEEGAFGPRVAADEPLGPREGEPGPSRGQAWVHVGGPVLVVGASPTPLTLAQLDRLEERFGVKLVSLDVKALLGLPEQREQEQVRAVAALVQTWRCPVTGIRTASRERDVLRDVPRERLALLNETLGLLVARVLQEARPAPSGLYLTGGDAAAAVCRALKVRLVEVTRQVEPLVAEGRLRGSPYGDLVAVTKGGLVGDEQTAVRCVQQLLAWPTCGSRHAGEGV